MSDISSYNIQSINRTNHPQSSYSLNSTQIYDSNNDNSCFPYEQYFTPQPNLLKDSCTDLDYKISQLKLENEQLINEMNMKKREKMRDSRNVFEMNNSDNSVNNTKVFNNLYDNNKDTYVQMVIKDNENMKSILEKYKEMIDASFHFFNLIQEIFQKEYIDFKKSFENIKDFKDKLLEIYQIIKDGQTNSLTEINDSNQNFQRQRNADQSLNNKQLYYQYDNKQKYHFEYNDDKENQKYNNNIKLKRFEENNDNCSKDISSINWKNQRNNLYHIEINNEKNINNSKFIKNGLPVLSFGNKSNEYNDDNINSSNSNTNRSYNNIKDHVQQKRIRKCPACLMNNNVTSRGYTPNECFDLVKKRKSRSLTPQQQKYH